MCILYSIITPVTKYHIFIIIIIIYYYYFITTLLLLAHYVLKSNIIQNRDSCILGYHTEAISAITRVYV